MPPIIDKTKCVACGVCIAICPMQIFAPPQKDQQPEVRFPEECWHCLCCEADCKQEALKVRLPLPLMMPYVDATTLHTRQGDDHE